MADYLYHQFAISDNPLRLSELSKTLDSLAEELKKECV
jgi:hypothetical protein